MSLLETACAELAAAKDALADFEVANRDTLRRHQELDAVVAKATEAVKKAAMTEVKEPCVKVYSGVEVTRVVSRLLDPEKVARIHGIENVPGAFKATVDAKLVAAAVRAGVLRAEDVDACRTLPHADYAKVA